MHTRRDQVKAYRFLTRRVNSAVLAADPNAPEQPMRRLWGAAVASVVVAIVALIAVAVYGLVVPGHATSWRDGNSLIVEKESKTRFVYVNGVLHPVLNWASARLILGGRAPEVVSVSAQSLRGVPRGRPVGIPGAPDELPDLRALRSGPWTLCSQLAPKADGTRRPAAVLTVGWAPSESALADDQALLVSGSDQVLYLMWQGQRLPIASASVVRALGMAAVQPVPVGAALLNTVSQGRTLGPMGVPSAGAAGPVVAGRRSVVGQVYVVGSSTGVPDQFYLLMVDGLIPLTPLQAAIQLSVGDPAAYPAGTVRAIPLTGAEAALLPIRSASIQDSGGPAEAPQPMHAVAERAQVCVIYDGSKTTAQTRTLAVRVADPVSTVVPKDEPVGLVDGALADAALLEPGTGALVRAESSPGSAPQRIYLVTGLGLKYPIDGDDALTSLGYSGVTPLPMPVGFIDLLRTGPVLSTEAAGREQAIAAAPGPNVVG